MTTKPYHKTSSSDKQAYVLATDLGGGGLKIALVSETSISLCLGHLTNSTEQYCFNLFFHNDASYHWKWPPIGFRQCPLELLITFSYQVRLR